MNERAEADARLAVAVGGRPVHFFLRPGMRDRHFDTVKRWAAGPVLNRDAAAGRIGSQVSAGDAARGAFRGGLVRRIPLLNVKRRPDGLLPGALLYTWGAIPTAGPYILDLDNPFALTGYNVPALRLYAPILRRLLQSPRCVAIVCMSRACRNSLAVELGPAVAAKAVVRYPYMDAPAAAIAVAAEGGPVRFLFVSTQFEIKGGSALLRAWPKVAAEAPGATLTLVTHLPAAWTERAAAMPGLTVLPATLGRAEIMTRCLAHADVLVHPTYYDSFGMVVLEALSAGLAIVATDVYALPELVEDGANGRLLQAPLSPWDGVSPSRHFLDFPHPDALARTTFPDFEAALADALIALARSPEKVAWMREASRALFLRRFAS